MTKCSYIESYYDYQSGREESYKCPDEIYSKGLCKFHLKEYAAEENNREGLIKLIEQKIEKTNKSGSSLKWFGYQIPPGFEISAKSTSSLYLGSATFLDSTDFYGSIFEQNAASMMFTSTGT